MRPSRSGTLWGAVLGLLGLVLVLLRWSTLRESPADPGVPRNSGGPQVETLSREEPSLLEGERILAGYGDPASSPRDDLERLARLMDHGLLLLKSAADRPLGGNEDWSALLRGMNAAHERFLPDRHVVFDREHRLVDRWGTPVFIHALGASRFELRSAGPDRAMWTRDDVVRPEDGHPADPVTR